MKKHIIHTLASVCCLTLSIQGMLVDFEGYTPGDAAEQTDLVGASWATEFGPTENMDIVEYDGGQALAIRDGSNGGVAGLRFLPSAGQLGFDFDNTSSVVTYSVDIARSGAATAGDAVRLQLVTHRTDHILLQYELWGLGDGMNFNYNSSGTTVSGEGSLQLTGSPFPQEGSGYFNITVVLDFGTNQISSVKYDGVEQLSSPLSLGDRADDAQSLGIYIIAYGSEPLMYFDNISLATEPEPPSGWYGYPISDLNWVDTGSWLGWVNIMFDPWVYSNDLQKYIYVPNDSGWVWVARP